MNWHLYIINEIISMWFCAHQVDWCWFRRASEISSPLSHSLPWCNSKQRGQRKETLHGETAAS